MSINRLLNRLSTHLAFLTMHARWRFLALGAVTLIFLVVAIALRRPGILSRTATKQSVALERDGAQPNAGSDSSVSVVRTLVSPKDGAEMIFVPPGEFIMGTDGGYANEKPSHTVFLEGFYIYKYEVTVAQYKAFLQEPASKGQEPDEPYDSYMPQDYFTNPTYSNHPVVNVSWENAEAYCRWAGNRMLSEAEWEKAARGTDGRTYPWGSAWDENNCSWDDESFGFRADGYSFTAPVGSYHSGVSPYGVYDMSGNAWEWVSDWYQPYAGNDTQDPDYGNTYRVIRGGSWLRYPLGLTTTARDTCAPNLRYNSIGFRCGSSPR